MPLVIVIIIVILLAYREYKTRRAFAEKKKLETAKKIIAYDTQTGVPIYEGERIVGYNTQTGQPIIEGREEPKAAKKEPKDKTKISNSILMFVGAGLIVFGTLVFLGTSYDSIPNIIKPFLILFIQLVFYGSYKICNDRLDIPKTGEVFKFLSFIFLPIFLISFSTFRLLGESLSLDGKLEGLYWAASLLISDVIFKYYAKNKNDIAIERASYFLEIGAILSIGDLINVDCLYMILLAIFTITISLLTRYEVISSKAYSKMNTVTSYIFMVLAYLVKIGETSFLYYMPFLLYSIYYFAVYFMENEEDTQVKYLALFFINYVLTMSFIAVVDVPRYFVYLLFVLPILLFARLTKKENIQKVLQYVVAGTTTIILIANMMNLDNSLFDTLSFTIGTIIYSLLFALFDNKDRPIYKLAAYVGLNITLISICHNLDVLELAKYVPLVTAILIYLLEKVVDQLQDYTSKHIVPLLLIVESTILTFSETNYLLLIPLVLTIAYTKYEKAPEEYIIVPALCSLSLFFNEGTPLNIGVCSALVLIYSVLSALKTKINIYTLVSLATIVIGLPSLGASVYIVFLTLAIWSLIHYITFDEYKKIFIITGIISMLGLYIKGLIDLDVSYMSAYFLGIYLAFIATTKLVIKDETKEGTILECLAFAIITFVSLFLISEPVDGIILIIIYFALTLFSFVNKYKALMYCSIVSMFVHAIRQTVGFWERIPIIVYVLLFILIGLSFIFFAMFDEKTNIKKNEQIETKPEENKEEQQKEESEPVQEEKTVEKKKKKE